MKKEHFLLLNRDVVLGSAKKKVPSLQEKIFLVQDNSILDPGEQVIG
jgi:hypothetical protein